MKKNIMTSVAVVCMLVAIMGLIYTKHYYVTELECISYEYKSQIDSLHRENDQLKTELEDLNDNVWNMINGEDFKVTVSHDGVTETYATN